MLSKTKSGYIAVIGKPNVGKSTFLNKVLGQKISITSKKPQTTRHQILGIKTVDNVQYLFIDTPGIHDKGQNSMSKYMNRAAKSTLNDVDIVLWLVEADYMTIEDEYVLSFLKTLDKPIILVVTKMDKLSDKKRLLPFIERMKDLLDFKAIVPISSQRTENLELVLSEIASELPEGPFYFEEGQITDKNTRFLITEIIREKIIRNTGQELPYATTVEIEDWQEKGTTQHISVLIWVERPGQKTIVIGKDGEKLKTIGTQARKEIEILLNEKVFLRLWIKVKENWSNDDRALRELGYG